MPNVKNFKVLINQDEDGVFVASVPSLPGCYTQGKTYEEAIKNVREAIGLCLEVAKQEPVYRQRVTEQEKPQDRFIGIADVSVNAVAFG